MVSLIFTTFLIKELIYEEGGELQRVNFDRHNLISWLSWLDLTFEGYSFVFSAIQKNQYWVVTLVSKFEHAPACLIMSMHLWNNSSHNFRTLKSSSFVLAC